MNNLKRNQSGFTLMEILVVMVIIGILVSIGINSLVSSQKKGRDARRKEDLHQLTNALEVYYNDNNRYPSNTTNGEIAACDASGDQVCAWGTSFENDNGVYMVQLPEDPVEGYNYFYRTNGSGRMYALYARLENDKDKDLTFDDNDDVLYYSSAASCGSSTLCNYAIGSTNAQIDPPTETE